MRLGGRQYRGFCPKIARSVVPVLVATIALIAVGTTAQAEDPSTAHLWSITRSADGHLHVVRGRQAAIAAMNARLGRPGDQVLSTEEDETVHATMSNDPMRPQQ